MVAAATSPMATLVPLCSALESSFVSVEVEPPTKKEPMVEASMPANAIAMGNERSEMLVTAEACSAPRPRANATSEMGARIDPA